MRIAFSYRPLYFLSFSPNLQGAFKLKNGETFLSEISVVRRLVGSHFRQVSLKQHLGRRWDVPKHLQADEAETPGRRPGAGGPAQLAPGAMGPCPAGSPSEPVHPAADPNPDGRPHVERSGRRR